LNHSLTLTTLAHILLFLALAAFADGLGYFPHALTRFVGVVCLAAAV